MEQDMLLEMERSVSWIMEVFTSEDLSDEVEEAIKRIRTQLLQCALLLEEEIPEGGMLMMQLRSLQSSLIKREEQRKLETANRQRGRPMISVTSSQVLFYLEHGCKINDIASLFGCSRRTIERCLQEVGVSVRKSYSQISDGALCQKVHGIIARNPRVGEKTVDGYLRAEKIVVQRQHIRDALHSVDPMGSQRRLRRALNRREYHVEHPNALWHVDGYHKLIRWGIVIHEGSMAIVGLLHIWLLLLIIGKKQHLEHFKQESKSMVFCQEFVLIREEKMFKLLNL